MVFQMILAVLQAIFAPEQGPQVFYLWKRDSNLAFSLENMLS
jgi:hypothetical protein